MKKTVLSALFLACALPLMAADSAVGAWVSRNRPSNTMTIEPLGASGRALTYRFRGPDGVESVVRVESRMDGSDAAVLIDGKPSGQTMAIKRVDARRTSTVLKMNGLPYGLSKAELSADGKILTVTNEIQQDPPGEPPVLTIDVWDRK